MEVKHQMDSDVQSANWEKHSDRFYTYEPCGITIPRSPDPLRWILHFLHSKIRTHYLKLPLPGFFFTALAADNELYFNHYTGVNSGWKIPERTHIQEYDPVKHERDDFMIRILEQVSLRERSDS